MQGVLSPADAQLAVQCGVDGVIVSNHGGRQLDYSPSALDMLPGMSMKQVQLLDEKHPYAVQ